MPLDELHPAREGQPLHIDTNIIRFEDPGKHARAHSGVIVVLIRPDNNDLSPLSY